MGLRDPSGVDVARLLPELVLLPILLPLAPLTCNWVSCDDEDGDEEEAEEEGADGK